MPEYISAKRLEEVKKEIEELKNIERKEIAKRIEEAKSLGDLSENAEYIEVREEQAFNEGKIEEYEVLIREAIIIEEEKGVGGLVVKVGDVIEVESEQKDHKDFKIVGSNEADPVNGKISNESPMGRALLGKMPGAKVATDTPSGKVSYKMIRIN